MKSYFLTFASGEFIGSQKILVESAEIAGGFTEIVPWTREKLQQTAFYKSHQDILDHQRGAGYWLWKPYIILDQLQKIEDGDFVVYWDCGKPARPNRFTHSIEPLLCWCQKHHDGIIPGVLVPWHGPNKKWTKRDCFVYMDCDTDVFRNHPQIQATFSIWQKNAQSVHFVRQWLEYALDPRIITDNENCCGLENDKAFVDHRHDQSILTNLAIKEGLSPLKYPLRIERVVNRNLNNLIRVIQDPLPLNYLRVKRASWRGFVTKITRQSKSRKR